jgi:hypothetical protein
MLRTKRLPVGLTKFSIPSSGTEPKLRHAGVSLSGLEVHQGDPVQRGARLEDEETATSERRGAMQKLSSPARGLEKNMINVPHMYARWSKCFTNYRHVLPFLCVLCAEVCRSSSRPASLGRTTLLAGNVPRRLVTACRWDEEVYLCLGEVGISSTTLLYSNTPVYTSSGVWITGVPESQH